MSDYLGLLRLDGRVALVTGGGNGIGRATCHALAQAGAHVAVTDVDQGAAAKVAAEIGGEAHPLDVADEAQVCQVVAAVAGRHGRLDILVNNAGLGARMPSVEMPTERWRQVLAVNVDGGFFCAREAGRHMLGAGRGAVVNVASIMGLVGGTHTRTSPTTRRRVRSSTSRARWPANGRPRAFGSMPWRRPSRAPG